MPLERERGKGKIEEEQEKLIIDTDQEKNFQDHVNTLRTSLQETHEHIKATLSKGETAHIPAYHRFGVELLSWVAVVVQSWVEQQKKKSKKEKKEWVKATLEPFITSLHELNTTLASLPFPEHKGQENSGIFADLPKELQGMIDQVPREVNTSHKQSQVILSAVIERRAKLLASLKV